MDAIETPRMQWTSSIYVQSESDNIYVKISNYKYSILFGKSRLM